MASTTGQRRGECLKYRHGSLRHEKDGKERELLTPVITASCCYVDKISW